MTEIDPHVDDASTPPTRARWTGWLGVVFAALALICATLAFHVLEPKPLPPKATTEPAAKAEAAPTPSAPAKTDAQTGAKAKLARKAKALAAKAKAKAKASAKKKLEGAVQAMKAKAPAASEALEQANRVAADPEYQWRVRTLTRVGLASAILGAILGLISLVWAGDKLLGGSALAGSAGALAWIVLVHVLSLILVVVALVVLAHLLAG